MDNYICKIATINEILRVAKTEVNIDIKREYLKPVQVMHHKEEESEYIHYLFITDEYERKKASINERINYLETLKPINNSK